MCDPEFSDCSWVDVSYFYRDAPKWIVSPDALQLPYLLKRTISKYIVITRIDDYKEQTIQ